MITNNPAALGFRNNNVTFVNDQSEFPPNDKYVKNVFNNPSNDISDGYNYQSLYPKNFENSGLIKDDTRYARQYSGLDRNFANQNQLQSIPAQAPGAAEGSNMVSFPTSRRKRDTDQVVPASIEKKENLESVDSEAKDTEGRALSAEKVK